MTIAQPGPNLNPNLNPDLSLGQSLGLTLGQSPGQLVPASLAGHHQRTVEAIFHHPSAHNLKWRDVIGLFEEIGDVHEHTNNEFIFEVSGSRHGFRKPHSKDLTSPEVIAIRHFLTNAGWSAEARAPKAASANLESNAPSLIIIVDHHEAKIFQVDVGADDISKHIIAPYDPHHLLHHLAPKGQSHLGGQGGDQPSYFQSIAKAAAKAGRIIIMGHGHGKSNAAEQLSDYLRSHHAETYSRVVREINADISKMTDPQLLDLARRALKSPA